MADVDLTRLADPRDGLAYMADLVGEPLVDWQRLELLTLITVVLGFRQGGKSRWAALCALWLAVREPGQEIILGSASEEGARRLLATALRFARAFPPLAASLETEHLGVIVLSNGSTIRALATSETAARGWSANYVFVDEAQLTPRSFWEALLPTLGARPGARIILLGTGGIADSILADLARAGDEGIPDHRTVRWIPTIVGGDCSAPWLQTAVVEAARRTMGASRFDAEYRAEFAGGGDTVFPAALLERQTADYAVETGSLANLQPSARGSLGVDWGERSDHSAAVVLAFFAGQRVLGIPAVRRWDAGEGIPNVVDEMASSPGHFAAVHTERNGLGGPSSQYLAKAFADRPATAGGTRGRRGFAGTPDPMGPPSTPPERRPGPRPFVTPVVTIFTTAALKAHGFGYARLTLEEDRLRLPAGATELLTELRFLRSELTQTGVERIAAGYGHDDLAMSFLMALQPVPDKRRGPENWRLRLADLADPRRPIREPSISPVEIDERTREQVLTGAGESVPRRPIWQSISGGELTIPTRSVAAARDRFAPHPKTIAAREAIAARRKEGAPGGA